MKDAAKASVVHGDKQTAFLAETLQKNIITALARLKSAQKTVFYCTEMKSVPVPTKPLVAPAPEPEARKPRFVDENRQSPLAPVLKDGNGTRSFAYVIEIPVPSKKPSGSVLYKLPFPLPMSVQEENKPNRSLFFSLRFVSAQGVQRFTSKHHLANAIVAVMRTRMPSGSSSVLDTIRRIVKEASADPEIRRYAD